MTAQTRVRHQRLHSPLSMAVAVLATAVLIALLSTLSPFAVGTVLVAACAVGVSAGYSTSGSV
ncbi:hypothetical protein [Micromonospora sp. NPDC049282]|uniref:hypothetical protein n=1 Tax=Micromonospora sp. NPDC049282 TaxID=3364269 RepID=UPI00371F4A65